MAFVWYIGKINVHILKFVKSDQLLLVQGGIKCRLCCLYICLQPIKSPEMSTIYDICSHLLFTPP